MDVAKNRIVSIDYKLTDSTGKVLDTSNGREPLQYLHGAGHIIPGLESALDGKAEGEKLNVTVQPEQAYGQRIPDMLQVVPRRSFQGTPELVAGMQFQGKTKDGPRIITVTKVEGDNITIDSNHPLAGETLNFEVTVVAVRDATTEELSHGHPHGPGGHQH